MIYKYVGNHADRNRIFLQVTLEITATPPPPPQNGGVKKKKGTEEKEPVEKDTSRAQDA